MLIFVIATVSLRVKTVTEGYMLSHPFEEIRHDFTVRTFVLVVIIPFHVLLDLTFSYAHFS